MANFQDLVFFPHYAARGGRHATRSFQNGYGVSVLFGDMFYSNGVDSYELAITYNGELDFTTALTPYGEVLHHCSREEVTLLMEAAQKL